VAKFYLAVWFPFLNFGNFLKKPWGVRYFEGTGIKGQNDFSKNFP
jgi:hypothetical protein